MITEITFDHIKNAGFSIKETFAIRKATAGLSPCAAFSVIEDMLEATDDNRYAILMNSLVKKIRV